MIGETCRSGRHLRREDDPRHPTSGHRTCRACYREAVWWKGRLQPGGSDRWAQPVVDQARHDAFARWSAGLDFAIRIIRLTEGHDGGAWQALGEFLETNDRETAARRSA